MNANTPNALVKQSFNKKIRQFHIGRIIATPFSSSKFLEYLAVSFIFLITISVHYYLRSIETKNLTYLLNLIVVLMKHFSMKLKHVC